MSRLIELSVEKGYTIGFLGGRDNVAIKLTEKLKKKYPKLRVGLAESDISVNLNGEIISGGRQIQNLELPLDILFVAFGQGKQEKWIYNNLREVPVKVMIGVGGAFDYLSGEVKRAPKWVRNLGFEWIYRLIYQPWRIKRFGALVIFVFKVLFSNRKAN
jgi:N-acetylglucosaminyldiphosphoundecaprenol N-acetyl-beta-D-mannosaminyltransferase